MFGRHRIAELTDQLTVSRGEQERIQQTLNAIASQIGYIEFSPSVHAKLVAVTINPHLWPDALGFCETARW